MRHRLAAVVVLAVLAGGCSNASTSGTSPPELPSRAIVTSLVVPQAPGPFPPIVLAHGLTGTPAKLTRLADAWATAGFVVALPAFPLTNGSVPDAAPMAATSSTNRPTSRS